MGDSSVYMEIVSGRRRDPIAWTVRSVLRALSLPYGGLVTLRNACYNSLISPQWLDIPVISVGNLTVGGTGKTPVCAWLCRRLLDRGLKPAVLSRGYKVSEEGLADELLMVSRQCPEAVMVAHPNRYKAGRLAVECYGARVAVLDDGFQHRRVGRDLDLLLVDATCPFGFGYVLPRGLLREPISGLARADAIILTRCDQTEAGQLDALLTEIRRVSPHVPTVLSVHQPKGFTRLDGSPTAPPTGTRIGCFAGIARPDAFKRTLARIGIEPVDRWWRRDHHRYTTADVDAIRRWVDRARLDALVTTEKDAVKLAAFKAEWPVPVSALHIEMEMLDDGEAVLAGLIDERLKEWAEPARPVADNRGQANEDHSRDRKDPADGLGKCGHRLLGAGRVLPDSI